ncbi:hypothetical protein LG71_22205 [Pluralibacter gergoviae]|uniref:hypothetical protein n=1 Tax=Pluralibacter gergoviae TaxID=61647 RepID=UPI0004F70B29|nr:hypothetical protein [Pluralibacter gergoviae]AIR02441.1 hypothetical protein LG71_22205 [Pluralibacter gergoviae]
MMLKKAIRSIAIALCFSIVNVWFFIEPVIFIASVFFLYFFICRMANEVCLYGFEFFGGHCDFKDY